MKNNKKTSLPMSSHEYAKHLLSKEDKPMYLERFSYVQGKDVKIYTQITGLNEKKIEGAYLIEDSRTSNKVNDLYFNIGDGLVELNGKKFYVSAQDLIYMIFNNEAIYEESIEEAISFVINKESMLSDIQKLKNEIELSITEGFDSEKKVFNLEEAQKWYKENFKDVVDSLT